MIFIKEREKLNSRSATRISQQILEGLVYLQDQHVIHEDLKGWLVCFNSEST